MNYSANQIEDFSLSLPITQTARSIAQTFAAQQPTPEKATQVRLNTLAVWVVNDYLQMMGIPTDLTASDSWNPVMRLGVDIADLEVTGCGRLECRAMRSHSGKGAQSHAHSCNIPPEAWEDRIGYVVVQLDDTLKQATVVGFVPTAAAQLSLSQLQPLENLLAHIHQLKQTEVAPSVNSNNLVKLSQWLKNIVDTDWQSIESIFGTPPNFAFNFRRLDNSNNPENTYSVNKVRRAKLIDLGLQLAGHSVALIVEIRPAESDQQTDILIQVHPTGSKTYLPPSLQLIVLDAQGEVFLEAQARRADNYIQLQFSGNPEERFSVKIALGDVSIAEHFVI